MIVFDSSYPGLVLSLRDVEFSSGSRCPEVPLNSFALKFSVSRGRFRIFASVRFVSSFLLLNSDRALGLRVFVWIVLLQRLRCPEVGLGFASLLAPCARVLFKRGHVVLALEQEPLCKQPRGRHAATSMDLREEKET